MAAKKAVKKAAPKVKSPLDEAKVLDKRLIQNLTLDHQIVFGNAKAGAKALKDSQTTIAGLLRGWDAHDVQHYLDIATAFRDAAVEAEHSVAKPNPTLQTDLAAAWPLRRMLLLQARGAAAAGLVPQERVDDIVRGSGALDCAADLVQLAKLFTQYAEVLSKKTSVTPEQLEQAKALGKRLQDALRAKGAKEATPSELAKARETRDRLYTLLTLAYDELWGVAALVFGRAHVDDAFPPLGSQHHHEQRKAALVAKKASDSKKAAEEAARKAAASTVDEPAVSGEDVHAED